MPQLITILKALSDETRLNLLRLLADRDLCGKALASHLGISEAAVSQHVKVLKDAKLLSREKRGYWTHYRVQKDVLNGMINDLAGIAKQSAAPDRQCLRLQAVHKRLSGEEVKTMCSKSCCEQPQKLQGKPGECSPQQIKECHGNAKDHPCKESGKK
jgi:ArsR family transcriptional regulator, arsenate/arsenite/antimonite-responsive transcriptional repressor